MKAITYLKKIEAMDAGVKTRLEEVENLMALATRTTVAMDGERVQSSGSQQKMADCVVKIAAAKEKYEAEVNAVLNYRREALEIVNENCDPDCIKLLYGRYFQYKDWEEIAEELKFSDKWVSGGLHQRALSQVQKALDRKEGAKCQS